jgi:hypothetical protein
VVHFDIRLFVVCVKNDGMFRGAQSSPCCATLRTVDEERVAVFGLSQDGFSACQYSGRSMQCCGEVSDGEDTPVHATRAYKSQITTDACVHMHACMVENLHACAARIEKAMAPRCILRRS